MIAFTTDPSTQTLFFQIHVQGAICLNDVINAEQKGARIFKVSTQTREYTLQTYSQRTTQAWVSIFQKKLWKPDSLPSKPFPHSLLLPQPLQTSTYFIKNYF